MKNYFTKNLIWAVLLILSILLVTYISVSRYRSQSQITKEELGKLIFFDNSLSEPPGQSCATCHRPERGFADTLGRAISEGAVKNLFNKRNAMAITYTAYIPPLTLINEDGEESYIGGLFWDGRADSLAHQAGMPFLDKLEMANTSEEMVVMKFIKAPYYKKFCKVYGKIDLSGSKKEEAIKKIYAQILNALSRYQASKEVNPFNSKYDAYIAGKYQMTENEKKGFELFKGKGLCSQCHILDIDKLANNVIFTDFTYDNLGIPKNTDSPFYNLDTSYNPDGKDYVDIGLMATTKREEDLGKFRVPTLRNIAKTAPYGHNGYFKDLASIVHFYNVRDVGDEFPPAECLSTVNKSELGNLGLTASEERYLIDFMNMLNDN
ncbi:MAG: cytochrome c peroxidase [Bacteroidales bacterium]